jgi:hypothetical protein
MIASAFAGTEASAAAGASASAQSERRSSALKILQG